MRRIVTFFSVPKLLLLLGLSLALASPSLAADFDTQRKKAEKYYAENSFKRSLTEYQKLDSEQLTPEQQAWWQFRTLELQMRMLRNQSPFDTDANQVLLQQFLEQKSALTTNDDGRSIRPPKLWAEMQTVYLKYLLLPPQQTVNFQSEEYQRLLQWWENEPATQASADAYLLLIEHLIRSRVLENGNVRPSYRSNSRIDVMPDYAAQTSFLSADVYYRKAEAMLTKSELTNSDIEPSFPEKYQLQLLAKIQWRLANMYQNRSQHDLAGDAWARAYKTAKKLGSRAYVITGTRLNMASVLEVILYQYGQWAQSYGQVTHDADGQQQFKGDYVLAGQLYRAFTRYYDDSDASNYYYQVTNALALLTAQKHRLHVPGGLHSDQKVSVQVDLRNAEKTTVSIYALPMPKFDQLSTRQLKDRDDPLELWKNTSVSKLTRQWQKSLTWSEDEQKSGLTKTASMDQVLPVGAYLAVSKTNVRGKEQTKRQVFYVTDIAASMQSDGERVWLFVANTATGEPVMGATVTLWHRPDTSQAVKWTGTPVTTTDEGLASFVLPNTQINRSKIIAVVSRVSQQQDSQAQGLAITRNIVHRSYSRMNWKAYVHTDRSVYRPGETVQWRAIVRLARDNGAYERPADEPIAYRIFDARNNLVHSSEVTPDSVGTIYDQFTLPDDVALGGVRINLEPTNFYPQRTELLQIEDYKRPEFALDLAPQSSGNAGFVRGDTVPVKLAARYYHGAPVANAKVTVTVSHYSYAANPVWPRLPQDSDMDQWLVSDKPPHMWGRPHYQAYSPYRNSQALWTKTFTTDSNGELMLSVDTDATLSNQKYVVSVVVEDSSRRAVSTSAEVPVAALPYYARLHNPQPVVGKGQTFPVQLQLVDALNRSVIRAGELQVKRMQWQEWCSVDRQIEPANCQGQVVRTLDPVLQQTMAWPATTTGQTNAEATQQTDLQLDEPGFYELRWLGENEHGNKVIAKATVLVTENASPVVEVTTDQYDHPFSEHARNQWGGNRIKIFTQTRDETGQLPTEPRSALPNLGDRLDVYVLAEKNAAIWLTTVGKKLRQQTVSPAGQMLHHWTVDITSEHMPNFSVRAQGYWDDRLHQAEANIRVPARQKMLQVNVELDNASYAPGTAAQASIRTQNHVGLPISAQVALAVSDASLLAIKPEISQDIRQFFYQRHRWMSLETSSSLSSLQFQQRDAVSNYRAGKDVMQPSPVAIPSSPVPLSGVRADKSAVLREDEGSKSRMEMANFADDASVIRRQSAASVAQNPNQPTIKVRNNFSPTAIWVPDVMTDSNGLASVSFTWPDSITKWQAAAKALTAETQVGSGMTSAVTQLPLIARLQTPRFLTVGDGVIITGLFDNNLDSDLSIEPSLGLQIGQQNGVANITHYRVDGSRWKRFSNSSGTHTLAANTQLVVEWKVKASQAGAHVFTLQGQDANQNIADGMQKTVLAYAYGITKTVTEAGRLASNDPSGKVDFSLSIPAERRAGSEQLRLQISPSIATSMLDALPYLVAYPYGCTEQTMSRFLPALSVAHTLGNAPSLGMSVEALQDKIMQASLTGQFGGLSQATLAKQSPAAALTDLPAITEASLERLFNAQQSDGGFGWWPTSSSDAYMTAYVVWGLGLALQQQVTLSLNSQTQQQITDSLNKARQYLARRLVKSSNPLDYVDIDLQAWMLQAVTMQVTGANRVDQAAKPAAEYLWQERENLSDFGKGLLAVSLQRLGKTQNAATLLDNLRDSAVVDNAPQISAVTSNATAAQVATPTTLPTARWGKASGYLHWRHSGVESTAWVLMAMLEIDPQHDLVVPAMNWLVKNRRAGQWNNTRDSAMAVLALNQYLLKSGELQQLQTNAEWVVTVNGTEVKRHSINGADWLTGQQHITVPTALLKTGDNSVTIERVTGTAPLYFLAQAEFFTQEKVIPPAGYEVFVERWYDQLQDQQTLAAGPVVTNQRLTANNNQQLVMSSGGRLEVIMLIEAKNDYQYLLFEDYKPAGLEAATLLSGANAYAQALTPSQVADIKAGTPLQDMQLNGRYVSVYQEMRDRKVANFIDYLPQGTYLLRYQLRAETPGTFAAMPVVAEAMYVPEIKANSSSAQWQITAE